MNSPGITAEASTREAAAVFGVPDFVYAPTTEAKGNATREISDGFIIVGRRGLILQSKLREQTNDAKLSNWVKKNTKKATRQVTGTRRRVTREATELVSERGHKLQLPPQAKPWPGVILLGVEDCPSGIDIVSTDDQTIVMTHDDWKMLCSRIQSASGLITYVERAVEAGANAQLGAQDALYWAMLEADLEYAAKNNSQPTLPPRLLNGVEQMAADSLTDWIHSDIAVAEFGSGVANYDSIRRAIEVIDSIPIHIRAEAGQAFIDRLRRVAQTRRPHSGATFLTQSDDQVLFFFDVAENWDSLEAFKTHVAWYAAVRHEEHLVTSHGADSRNVATLLVARMAIDNGPVARTFVLIQGWIEPIPSTMRHVIHLQHGRRALVPTGVRAPLPARNDRCPCGSGIKFKKCHMP